MRINLIPVMVLSVMTISPMTISNVFAQETVTVTTPVEANVFYVSLNGLRVRSTPEDAGKTMGLLSLNERVRVLSPELINGKYVQIEIIKTVNKIQVSEKYYVVREYLSEKIVDYKDFTGKYFTVLNVATETLRVYERQCLDNSCPHKMIMETEVVVGEDTDHPAAEKGKGRSVLGSYRLTGWAKFYQDPDAHYPAWYRDGYPALPDFNDNSWRDWFKKDYMPADEKGDKHGKMRGAFGWYAGFVAPNPFGQWTHGTVGWGKDKDQYIKKTKKLITNIVSNPRSSGCTRNNNEAIAFIRQLIDTGAPMIKIYAKEALRDPSLAEYRGPEQTWQYILTKKAGEKSDRAEVLKSLNVKDADVDAFWAAKLAGGELILDPKSPLNQILEMGTYTLDSEPTVINYTPGEKLNKLERSVGRKGNVYGVKSKDMSNGVFYVDAGFLEGYAHPTSILEISGFEDETTPPWMDVALLK
ncbi:MAG: L,D-transpeptidase family protein [Bdellovibrionales bacterium]|nr:L,D-transpeptidase family protein [Bdellovibrionales bacterium]